MRLAHYYHIYYLSFPNGSSLGPFPTFGDACDYANARNWNDTSVEELHLIDCGFPFPAPVTDSSR